MIGTYYRLSLADEDVGADKVESNSIQGQRGLVEGYIMARPELAKEPLQEYVDDGYSGTSTSRPAFQRLIQDAQDGKLSVCMAWGIPKWRTFLCLPLLVTANHLRIRGFEVTNCKEYDLKLKTPMVLHADGEYCGDVTEMHFQCLPKKLHVMW